MCCDDAATQTHSRFVDDQRLPWRHRPLRRSKDNFAFFGGNALDAFELADGYAADAEARRLLDGLGLRWDPAERSVGPSE